MNAKQPATRHCHAIGCTRAVPAALAGEGLCLDHFFERVIRSADDVRARCMESEPVNEEMVGWLLGDARHATQALSLREAVEDVSENEKVLEMLLCLANLQHYITHHSLRVKSPQ